MIFRRTVNIEDLIRMVSQYNSLDLSIIMWRKAISNIFIEINQDN